MGGVSPDLDMYGNDPVDTALDTPPIAGVIHWDDNTGVRLLHITFTPHQSHQSCMHEIFRGIQVWFDVECQDYIWLSKISLNTRMPNVLADLDSLDLLDERAFSQMIAVWEQACDGLSLDMQSALRLPAIAAIDAERRRVCREYWRRLHWKLHDRKAPHFPILRRVLFGQSPHPVPYPFLSF